MRALERGVDAGLPVDLGDKLQPMQRHIFVRPIRPEASSLALTKQHESGFFRVPPVAVHLRVQLRLREVVREVT